MPFRGDRGQRGRPSRDQCTVMSESPASRVILVMKQPGNLRVVCDAVGEVGMTGVGVSSEDELVAELRRESPARMALVDVTGFGRDVWGLCELLQRHDVTFIVLSAANDSEIGSRSVALGARSVLQKPVAKRALLELVRNLGNS